MISRILCKLAEINNQTTNQWPNVVKHNLRQLFLIFVYKYLFEKCWTHNQTNQSIQVSFPGYLSFNLLVCQRHNQTNQSVHLIFFDYFSSNLLAFFLAIFKFIYLLVIYISKFCYNSLLTKYFQSNLETHYNGERDFLS